LASLLQMLPADVTLGALNPEQTRDRYGVETCDRQVLPVLQASASLMYLGWRQLNARCHERCQPILLWGLMALAQQVKLKTPPGQGIGPEASSNSLASAANVC